MGETPVCVQNDQEEIEQHKDGVVISFTFNGESDVWHSDDTDGSEAGSGCSSTSTPGYKRGHHSELELQQVIWASKSADTRATYRKWDHPYTFWQTPGYSFGWIMTICVTDFHQDWSLKKWIASLRAETVRVKCNTVVLYLEKTQEFNDSPPLKNVLHTICKIIRQHNRGARIFISNLLPKIGGSPIGKARTETNFVLLQAVRSVNQAMGKVHFLSLYEHFVSAKEKVIKPTHKYFRKDNIQLTHYGCMIMRECLLWEAGLKSYWFQ